jgi:hemerythrin superfamily protein
VPRAEKTTDPIEILKRDHEEVRGLFDEFESTTNKRSQGRIVREALLALDVHAGIEEEIYYPAVEEALGESEQESMAEAEEEHHVVHLLISELRQMTPADEHFSAKFMVLMENVRHHMEEEEKEMLPKAAKAIDGEQAAELAEQMWTRKQELTREFKAQYAA